MVEFNPDGSLKLPGSMQAIRDEQDYKMRNQRCLKIKRNVVNFTAPKKCVLSIKLSDAVDDNRFVSTIYGYFQNRASVPSKLNQIDSKNFEVEIGTDFRRCSDCTSLIGEFREFMQVIENKGNCTFKGMNFSYEDYFD